MRSSRLLIAVVALAAAAAPLPARAHPPVVPLAGHLPSWATPANRVGPADPAAEIEVQLLLPWRDPAAARAYARSVSDPGSPAYRRFLTPAGFRDRFAPAPATVTAVQEWFRASGLRAGTGPANRIVVPARGTVAQVARAFGTTLGRYRAGGQVLRAPDRAPTLPATIARRIRGVRGLDESTALIRPDADALVLPVLPVLPDEPPTPADTPPPAAVVYAKPCSAYDGEKVATKVPAYAERRKPYPYVTCATTPAQLRSAYGVPKGLDGSGQTIVMTGSHAIKRLPADLNEWSKRRGIPVLKDGQLQQISHPGGFQAPSDPNASILRPQVWAVQTATLFEHIRAVAPAANLVYVGSTSSFDIPTATLLAVDAKLGNVVVNGWYTVSENVPQPEADLISQIAEQAASTGISLLFASGDLGDGTRSGSGSPGPVYPANDPMVTAVGATSLLLGKGGRYLRELAWARSTAVLTDGEWEDPEDATYRASGGGVSNRFDRPEYQEGVVPDAVAERETAAGFGRVVPDIAVTGDGETAMLIGYTQRFPDGTDRYSERRLATDTSATALFGAFVALLNQRAEEDHGFVNPLLYQTWSKHRGGFRDIVPSRRPSARVRIDYVSGASGEKRTVLKIFEDFTEAAPRKGFDTATGLGSPSPAFWKYVT